NQKKKANQTKQQVESACYRMILKLPYFLLHEMFYPSFLINTYLPFYYFSKSISRKGRDLSSFFTRKKDWTCPPNLFF
ncbi:TPA_asm: hypothetical protein GZM43_17760, partial [Listeria monocytogenes]|nr:hypothetical protein [Listeria monocytogenes]